MIENEHFRVLSKPFSIKILIADTFIINPNDIITLRHFTTHMLMTDSFLELYLKLKRKSMFINC